MSKGIKRVALATTTFGYSEVYRAAKGKKVKKPKKPTAADAMIQGTNKQKTKYKEEDNSSSSKLGSSGDNRSILGLTLKKKK